MAVRAVPAERDEQFEQFDGGSSKPLSYARTAVHPDIRTEAARRTPDPTAPHTWTR